MLLGDMSWEQSDEKVDGASIDGDATVPPLTADG